MDAVDEQTEQFLAEVLPRFEAAEVAIHDGDPSARIAMWSHSEPVSLFGAALSEVGWPRVELLFERLGASFSGCTSFSNEVIVAQAVGDMGYVVALEHTTTSVDGRPVTPYVLRVTTVYRRENGEWRIVHRHADPANEESTPIVDRLGGRQSRS